MDEQVQKRNRLFDIASTAVGFLVGLGMLAMQASNVMDSDPATVLDSSKILEGLGFMGLGWLGNKVGFFLPKK